MARKKELEKADLDKPWNYTVQGQLVGQALIDQADKVANEMELKWGCGRLRLLMDGPTCERFDLQTYKYNRAVRYGSMNTLQQEVPRMINAWRALDRLAEAAGARLLDPKVIETRMPNGTVAAIVADPLDVDLVIRNLQGRDVRIYTGEEIGRLLQAYPTIVEAKAIFPGAEVMAIRKIGNPMDALRDCDLELDDEIPDLGHPVQGG